VENNLGAKDIVAEDGSSFDESFSYEKIIELNPFLGL